MYLLQQGKFVESIEAMLTKMEEFCGLVDMVCLTYMFFILLFCYWEKKQTNKQRIQE
jgi:hypothetical protein